MLEIAKIRVDGIFADVVERSPITANLTGGCIRVEYAPGIWDGLTKTIVFKGSTTKDVVTNEVVIEIPPETVAAPSRYLQVGFFGVDAQRKLIIPTLWANLGYLQPGADPSGDTSTDPSLPVWAQLADQIKRLEESGVVVDPEAIQKIVDEYLAENPPSGGNVDLTGYATEEWVEKGYQPKGNYLTEIPEGYAKTSDIPTTPEQVGADPKGTAAGAVSQHNTDETAHNDLRLELKRVSDRLAEFLDSDDEKLDQLSELIAGISSNKTLIEAVTTGKVSVTDIIDNLTTNVANKPLSAAQGVVLKGLIDNVSKSLSNYQPKGDYALRSEIPSVPVQSVNGKTGAVQLSAADVGARPSDWVPTAADVGALPSNYIPPNQTAEQVGADPKGTASGAVSQHNTDETAHNDLRLELKRVADRLAEFLDSDDEKLDQLSELIAGISSNKTLIEAVTTGKVSVTDIIDNLTTNVANKPLSAAQGVVLKGLIDAISKSLSNYALKSEIPTKASQLTNDSGYLTKHQDISGLLPRTELPTAINTALAQAKQSGEFNGKDGTSVTVKKVTESTEDGGSNVVEFSDGKKLTIKNGRDGKNAENPDAVPDYWQTALDNGVKSINTAIESAGRNKSAFLYYTDAHNGYGSGMAPVLLKYLGKHTAMNKTIFGGDFSNTYEYPDTGKTMDDWMDIMRSWRLAVRDIRNHHSVAGNHDKEIDALSTDKALYGFLFAPEETPDIVRGGDFYYYIDEPSEKTRYIYLNTGLSEFDDDQCEFVIDALKSLETGWHIVAVSHIWFQYDSTNTPTVGSVPANTRKLLALLDAYNARKTGNIILGTSHVYDFSDCGGWVEFCIGGHTHVDYTFTSEMGIPVILCCTDSKHLRGSGYTYTEGTSTESAVNGVVADYDAKKIKVIRIGRGESYEVEMTWYEISYNNLLPKALAADGVNIYNADETPGYKSGIRWSSSSNAETTVGAEEIFLTGYIPAAKNDVIYLKHITMLNETGNACMVHLFNGDLTKAIANANNSNLSGYWDAEWDDNGNLIKFVVIDDSTHIRIQCSGMDSTSIITKNEPIL